MLRHNTFVEKVAIALATIFMATTFTVMMVEWAVGCGETYVDAYGKRHAYECMFLTTPDIKRN